MNTRWNQQYKCTLKQRWAIFIFKSYANKLYQLDLKWFWPCIVVIMWK